ERPPAMTTGQQHPPRAPGPARSATARARRRDLARARRTTVADLVILGTGAAAMAFAGLAVLTVTAPWSYLGACLTGALAAAAHVHPPRPAHRPPPRPPPLPPPPVPPASPPPRLHRPPRHRAPRPQPGRTGRRRRRHHQRENRPTNPEKRPGVTDGQCPSCH